MQGSADSSYSHPSSDLSLDEDGEVQHVDVEKHALTQLERAEVGTLVAC